MPDWAKALGGLVLVAGLIIYAISTFEAERTINAARQLTSPGVVAAAAIVTVCTCVSIALRAVRWVLLMGDGLPVRWPVGIAGFGWCFLLLQIVPFRAGEVSRPVWVKLRGGSAMRTIASVVVERMVDTALLALVALGVLAFLPDSGALVRKGAFLGALILPTGAFCLVLLLPSIRAALPQAKGSAIVGHLDRLIAAFADMRNARGLLVLALSVAAWAVAAAGYSYFLGALSPGIGPAGILVLAMVNLSSFVTIAPGNIGVFQTVAVAVLTFAGWPGETALLGSVGLHAAVFLGQGAFGIASWIVLTRAGRNG